MDVPAEILPKLKCHKCKLYLSWSPVYLEHIGAATCGRCFSHKRPATHNEQYEAVAKLLRFPCKNRDLGCGKTVGFEEVAHEGTCSFKCPVLKSSKCDWQGPRSRLLEHCQEEHPRHVLINPCILTHDTTKTSLRNYVLQAFQLLFLLVTEVSEQTGWIYYSVRLLDRDDMTQDYSYKLHSRRGGDEVIKRGEVTSQGCQRLKKLEVSINSFTGDWSGVECTVTIEKRRRQQETVAVEEPDPEAVEQRGRQQETVAVEELDPEAVEQRGRQQETVAVEELDPEAVEQRGRKRKRQDTVVEGEQQEKCSKCGAEVTVKLYRDEGGWQCKRCAPTRQTCRYKDQGCKHKDIPDKCRKHEKYFCRQRDWCLVCGKKVFNSSSSSTSEHRHPRLNAGSTWRATRTDRSWKHYLVAYAEGTAACSYKLIDSRLILQVYMPVPSKRLCEFRCEIRLTHPSTGRTRTYTPDVKYTEWQDWHINITERDFPSWTDEFDISVNIFKLQN